MSAFLSEVVCRATAACRAVAMVLTLLALPCGQAVAQNAACNPEATQLTLPGGNVHYLQTGTGPRVVLLHGLFAQKEQWVPFMCLIAADGYQAIAPDLPGFGQSTGFPLQDYKLENQVDALRTLLDKTGGGKIHLAGNSMGGAIAGLYQRKFPQDVRSLAFIGAPLGVERWSPRLKAALDQGINPFIPVTAAQFELELSLLFFQPPVVPEQTVAALVEGYKSHFDQYLAVWNLISGYPPILLEGKHEPVRALAVWGVEDGVYDVSGLQKLASVYRELRSMRLERNGHLPMVENPDAVAKIYAEFLR